MKFGLKVIHMTTTLPQDQPTPQMGVGIDPALNAVIKMVLPASREDFYPQDILKFHRSSSLE